VVTKQLGGPGRPPGDARSLAVREALLQAARNYFSFRGFQRASLRAIAAEARVNPAMVSYYFGNKEGLLIAVLSETVAPLIDDLENLNAQAAGRDTLRNFLLRYARMLLENPWLPNLLVREVMFHEGKVRDAFIARFASRVSGSLRRLLEHDIDSGDLPEHIDPVFGALGILSLTIFPFVAQPAVERAFNVTIDERFIEHLTDHTVALLFGATNEPVTGDPECVEE
jgi:AcrR family transcriptional regulator